MEIKIDTPDSALLVKQSMMQLEIAQAYVIDSDEMYLMAGDDLKGIKAWMKMLEDKRTATTKPINDGLKIVNAMFKQPMELLVSAEGLLKGSMLTYQDEQESKRRQEQARLDEEARKERERLAAAAIAQEACARELQRQADEAAEAGNEVEAAKLSAAALVAEEDAVATAAIADVIPAAMPTIRHAAPKIAGISTREVLKAEVTDIAALVKHIAANPQYIELIEVNNKALQQLAKALGMKLELPGVRVYAEKQLAAGRG